MLCRTYTWHQQLVDTLGGDDEVQRSLNKLVDAIDGFSW